MCISTLHSCVTTIQKGTQLMILALSACISITATSVNFEQSTYSVYEDSGLVELVLVLSNPSSTDLTIGVKMFDQQTPTSGMYIATYTLKHWTISNFYCSYIRMYI